MNRTRIKLLRDHLASLPDEKFQMRFLFEEDGNAVHEGAPQQVLHNCGTAACIAGWALALFQPNDDIYNLGAEAARKSLGLDDWRATELFTPNGYRENLFTRQMAVETLDRLLETGEVQWR